MRLTICTFGGTSAAGSRAATGMTAPGGGLETTAAAGGGATFCDWLWAWAAASSRAESVEVRILSEAALTVREAVLPARSKTE